MIEAITEVQPSVALFNLPTTTIEHKEEYDIKINEKEYSKALERLPSIILEEDPTGFFNNEENSSKSFNLFSNLEPFALERLSREEEMLYFRALRFFQFVLDPKEGTKQLETDRLARLDPPPDKKKIPKIPFFEPKENVLFFQLLNEKVGLDIRANIDMEREEDLYQILFNDNVLEIDKERYRKGAKEIINNIMMVIEFSNILLVKSKTLSIKHPFVKNNSCDILQEGFTSLKKHAIRKFNHTLGFKFSTYAVPWIRQTCMTYIDNYDRTIRTPSLKIELFGAMSTILDDEETKQESSLNAFEQNDVLLERGYSESQIVDLFNFENQDPLSLDLPYNNKQGEEDNNLYSFIIEQKDPASNMIQEEKKSFVIEKLLSSGLTKKEFTCLYTLFGFFTGGKIAPKDVGSIMNNVTPPRISQLKNAAFKKIKNNSNKGNTKKETCTPLFNSELEARNHIILHYWIPYTIKKSFTLSDKGTMLMKQVYPIIEMHYGLNGTEPLFPKDISSTLELPLRKIQKKMIGIKSILKSNTIPPYIIPKSPTYYKYLEDMRLVKRVTVN